MAAFTDELKQIHDDLKKVIAQSNDGAIAGPLEALDKGVERVGKSWSGSPIGYHARVYYRNLYSPPAGARFSSEWGLQETMSWGTTGDWVEYTKDEIVEALYSFASNPDLGAAKAYCDRAKEVFERNSQETIVILEALRKDSEDAFISRALDDVKKIKIYTRHDYAQSKLPGQMVSRDAQALSQGFQLAPHQYVAGEIIELRSPKLACEKLVKEVEKVSSYLNKLEQKRQMDKPMTGPKKVFIGHGQSNQWKELKDFLVDKLNLPYEEYNRVPTAGVSTTDRLQEMLGSSSFAFLIMTAEDETKDGKLNARLNVIHEVGLFQGRLGIKKAIVLLEEGCEEFSNIVGLGQIRYPKGKIGAKSEEIRDVLKREGIID
jgi:predicted nucleotide-binding protein